MSEQKDLVDKAMEGWIKELPELDSSSKAIFGRIQRLKAIFVTEVEKSLSVLDITPTMFSVLASLRIQGGKFELHPKELSEIGFLTSGGTSNLLAQMEKRGLITRIPDPNDRRAILVRLLPKGKELAELAMERYCVVEARLAASLAKDEQEHLSQLLRKLLLTLEA